MNTYQHLTLFEREKIMLWNEQGKNINQIAIELNRHKSTISRELKRNIITKQYSACLAQTAYHIKRLKCRQKKKLEDPKLFECVRSKFLEHQWSPEQIQNRLKRENSSFSISFTTLYREIYGGRFNEKGLSHGARGAARKLRHRGKTRHTKGREEKRGKIVISHPLTERPQEAESRIRKGDWEADTVLGIAGGACLLTLTDRHSRYLICSKLSAKKADDVQKAMIEALRCGPRKSITPDRGKGFAKHQKVTNSLDVEFYFPLPHQPWQRGTNENTNGLLREYFPKQQDIGQWDKDYIEVKVNEINHRPRKCLNWKTAYEVYFDKVLHLV